MDALQITISQANANQRRQEEQAEQAHRLL